MLSIVSHHLKHEEHPPYLVPEKLSLAFSLLGKFQLNYLPFGEAQIVTMIKHIHNSFVFFDFGVVKCLINAIEKANVDEKFYSFSNETDMRCQICPENILQNDYQTRDNSEGFLSFELPETPLVFHIFILQIERNAM